MRKKYWYADICSIEKRHYLSGRSRFKDAVKARKAAEGKLHGKFMREFAGTAKQKMANG